MSDRNGEFDDDELDAVDEKYLQEPEYGDERINIHATEDEAQIPWWMDDENEKTQLIGKYLGYILLFVIFSVGLSLAGGGDLAFGEISDVETDMNNSNENQELKEAKNNTEIVKLESIDRHNIGVVSTGNGNIGVFNESERQTIRLYGSYIPSTNPDNVNTSMYGMDDTESIRQCLADHGQDAESMMETELGDGKNVVLFRQGENFENDSYDGNPRYYAIGDDQTVSYLLIQNGLATVPEWDFEIRSEHVSGVRNASNEGVGIWSCGDGNPPKE